MRHEKTVSESRIWTPLGALGRGWNRKKTIITSVKRWHKLKNLKNPTWRILLLFNMASMLFCNISMVGKSRNPGVATGAGLTGLRNPNNWLDLFAIKARIGLGLTPPSTALTPPAFIIKGWGGSKAVFLVAMWVTIYEIWCCCLLNHMTQSIWRQCNFESNWKKTNRYFEIKG